MANKIKRLSERQVAKFATYQKKWISIGLNTEPTDIPAAEAAIKLCYKLAGLTAPQSIICMDSPLSAVLNEKSKRLIENQVFDQVWNQVRNQIYAYAWAVYNLVWVQIRQVRNNHTNTIVSYVLNQIQDCANTKFHAKYGCHDAVWLSYYDYLREVCGFVKETEKIAGMIAIAKCCGWWMPYKDVVVIQHRPCFIGFDDDKQLHCENGMAIKYRDGFGVWAIHGVRVDEQIVMKPYEQTIKQITEEGNVEKKRIRIERFGWNRYLIEINAKVIDNRHNEIENTEETLVRTPDGMTILLPTCKTGRLFSLEVPSEILTCEQAQNWLHGGSQLDEIVGKTRVIGRS